MRLNRIIYMVFLLLAAATAAVYGRPVSYAVLYSLILLPLITLGGALLFEKRLAISQSFDKNEAVKGETVRFTLEIRNNGIFFFPYIKFFFMNENEFALRCEQFRKNSLTAEARPGKTAKTELDVLCKYRGVYQFGFTRYEIYDSLGLFKLKRKAADSIDIKVFPTLREMDGLRFSLRQETAEQSAAPIKEEDFTNIADFKKYEPSDSFKRIHWKLTAKKNELMVKEFQSDAAAAALFLLDTNKPSGDKEKSCVLEDMLVENVVSAVNLCAGAMTAFKLVYVEGGEVKTLDSLALGFPEVYSRMAGLKFEESYDFAALAEGAVHAQEGETSAVVISSRLDAGMYELLRGLKALGNEVIFINSVLEPDGAQALIKRNLLEDGIICYE